MCYGQKQDGVTPDHLQYRTGKLNRPRLQPAG